MTHRIHIATAIDRREFQAQTLCGVIVPLKQAQHQDIVGREIVTCIRCLGWNKLQQHARRDTE
jgi:hypothetical protein